MRVSDYLAVRGLSTNDVPSFSDLAALLDPQDTDAGSESQSQPQAAAPDDKSAEIAALTARIEALRAS